MNDKTLEVSKALAEWILRITDEYHTATPEEIEALPKVAEVFFGSVAPF